MKEVPQSPAPLNNLPASSAGEVPSAGRPSDQLESPRIDFRTCACLDNARLGCGRFGCLHAMHRKPAPSPSAEVSR